MTKLTGNSIMMFGKFQGQRMTNVPSSYLLWIYENLTDLRLDVKMYIEENMAAIKMEAKATKYFRR